MPNSATSRRFTSDDNRTVITSAVYLIPLQNASAWGKENAVGVFQSESRHLDFYDVIELTATPFWCHLGDVTDITSKTLHEKTGQVLDRARQGERFRVLRDGQPEAFLIPAAEAVDPSWAEIMGEVWKAAKKGGAKRENRVLKERKARNYAARVR